MVEGSEIWTAFVLVDGQGARAHASRATVISAEHGVVRRSYGVGVLAPWETIHATEAEALADCAAQLRARARQIDAKADEVAAQAAALGVGPAKPE